MNMTISIVISKNVSNNISKSTSTNINSCHYKSREGGGGVVARIFGGQVVFRGNRWGGEGLSRPNRV